MKTFTLLGSLAEHLTDLGYQKLPIKKGGAAALFFKKGDGVFLTLGIEAFRRYKESFTGTFYLAPTLSWSYAPADGFPPEGYRRIGEALTPAQRKRIAPKAKNADVWWYGFTPENTLQFAHFVKIAESKFLTNAALVKSVKECDAIRDLLRMIGAVQCEYRRMASAGGDRASGARERELVAKVAKEKIVPSEWYLAAAKSAREQFPILNQKYGIKMLAEDSWLQSEFG
jgi:hypothetical protein